LRNSDRLDIAAQEIDRSLQPLACQLEPDQIVFQNFEVGLGLEIGICGRIRLLPCCLDLSGGSFGIGVASTNRGRDRNNGSKANNGQAQASRHTSKAWSSHGAATLRSSGAGITHTLKNCSWHCDVGYGHFKRLMMIIMGTSSATLELKDIHVRRDDTTVIGRISCQVEDDHH
jgi:hypothetical protein